MSYVTSNIVVPDVINVLPHRCRRGGGRNHEPYWSSDQTGLLTSDFSTLTFGVRSVTPRPHVTFGRKRLTFSFISAKTLTTQQGEGPWEYLLSKHLEANPNITDYAFHNVETTWTDRGIVERQYAPDAIWVDVEGRVTCTEVKASRGYFWEPKTRAICDAASKGFAAIGVRFAEVTGDSLQEDRRRTFNISRAFADRLTHLSERQIEIARDGLAGGDIPLARLGEMVGVHPSAVLQVVNAMMVRRLAAYDLSARVTPDLSIQACQEVISIPDIRSLDA